MTSLTKKENFPQLNNQKKILKMDECRYLIKKNLELLEEIQEITSSPTYRFAYYLNNPKLLVEKCLFKLFPYWLIPVSIRQKIRQIINFEKTKEKDFYYRINKINQTKKDYRGDIIIYSIIAWGYRFQRPQQLAIQLRNQGYRIWYIKNEFIISTTLTPNRFAKIYQVDDDIFEVTLPSRSPLFIYTDELNERNASLMRTSLDILINSLPMKNVVQILDHPFWVNLVEKIPFPIIYDCMDDHQSFEISGKEIDYEKKLVKKADAIIVTSNYLKEKMSSFSNKLTLIRNACDFKHFNNPNIKINPQIKNIKHPIIGYYGALAEWFDISILEETIKINPQWSFVLIGLITDKSIHKKLSHYKNVYFFGEQPYKILPEFLKAFDVCIIPFKLTSLILATDPVKFYEMLAAGKPVVSVKIPEIASFKEPILYLVDKNHDFTSQIKKALKKNSPEAIAKRIAVAQKNDWSYRGKQLINIIDHIYPKVSIIILTYNNWPLTKNCLKSLETDGYPNKEIIVVDNASTDETPANLKKLAEKNKIIAILNKKNLGFAKGNNIGLKKATGQYIALLNNDVEVTPFWIQKFIRHLKNDPSIGLIGPVTNESGNESRIFIRGSKSNIIKKGINYANNHFDKLFNVPMLAAQCWFMRKTDMKKVGYLDERFSTGMFEDDDYCLRFKQIDKKIVCAEDVFIYHKGKASFNRLDEETYLKIFTINKIKFEKKWGIKWIPHKSRKMKFL